MKRLMIAVGSLAAAVLVEIIRELRSFRVVHYNVESPKLGRLRKKRRIVFLSDLHNCRYGDGNERLYRAIEQEAPDLILIGGDMLIRKDGASYEETAAFLSRLPQICEVYCANGNHEQKLKERADRYRQSYKDYRDKLVSARIHMLENETVTVEWESRQVDITGLEIPLYGYGRFGRKPISVGEIEKRIGKAGGSYQILLAHHPGYAALYREWGADLVLSGHLHGGVVRVPGIGGIIAPDLTIFPRYSGDIYKEQNMTIVVSKGLGVHSLPIRLFNPAEVIVLEF